MNISIIIPVYNKSIYIDRLLSQIQKQSYDSYECIIIDDGSNDGSEIICDKYAQRDNRFKVIHIANSGVSNARNIGLDVAKGKYITFIDADDEISNDYLQQMNEAIEKSGADFVIAGHTKFVDGSNKEQKCRWPFIDKMYSMKSLMPEFAENQRKYGLYGWCWAKIFVRTLTKNIRFEKELKLAEDFDYYLHLYKRVKKVYFSSNTGYRYRTNSQNGSMISAADDRIDYYSQLQLNLRYRLFLIEMSSLYGKNLDIVDELLSRYSYYSLFYCDISNLKEMFTKVHKIYKSSKWKMNIFHWKAAVVLFGVRFNLYHIVYLYLYFYKSIRNSSLRARLIDFCFSL